MTRFKNVMALVIALVLVLVVLRFVRNGESADINLVKKACHIVKGDDGKFEVETWNKLNPDFNSWSLRTEDPQKIEAIYAYFAREVLHATVAAQINPIWRPLADAQVDAMNIAYYAVLLVRDNPNSDRIYEVMPTLNAALNKVGVECAAFRDRLNS